MDHRNQSSLGVAAAIKHFCNIGAEVFCPLSDGTNSDLVVDLGTDLYRVQVKSTANKRKGKWVVQLATNVNGKTARVFDGNRWDYLFVYIEPEDRHVLISTKNISNKYQITI